VLESSWPAGYDGRPSIVLTEYTDHAQRTIDLPDSDAYTAVIEHVIACLQRRAVSRLGPASVLDSLRVTLDVHRALNPNV
jgi:UDP-N-acetylglucosamine 3-dehydrogenase